MFTKAHLIYCALVVGAFSFFQSGTASAADVCSKTNKFYGQPITTSVPIYAGSTAAAVDCMVDDGFFNLPTSTGWFRVSLPTPQCFSAFRLMPTMSPEGDVTLRIHLEDSNLEDISSQEYSEYMVGGQFYVFKLSSKVCGVSNVRIETESSPSWIGWLEARGG